MVKQRTKILIVDDDESFLKILDDFLEANGYEVKLSVDGNQAKNDYTKFQPDIVLTDIVMPSVDGIELLISLREINPELRIIAMSGGNTGHGDTYLQMAGNLGANIILNKPFKLAELLEQIKELEAA